MEILDPDLWDDDGKARKPSQGYMESLEQAQALEALDPEIEARRAAEEAAALKEFKQTLAPIVGDVVHFCEPDTHLCRAAVVMEVEGHVATLRVHVPHQNFQDWESDHDEGQASGTWHWAEGQS